MNCAVRSNTRDLKNHLSAVGVQGNGEFEWETGVGQMLRLVLIDLVRERNLSEHTVIILKIDECSLQFLPHIQNEGFGMSKRRLVVVMPPDRILFRCHFVLETCWNLYVLDYYRCNTFRRDFYLGASFRNDTFATFFCSVPKSLPGSSAPAFREAGPD